MKDLGSLSYFLGISVSHTQHGTFLCQQKYASKVLARADMSSCRSSVTGVNMKSKLSVGYGKPMADRTLYRRLARALKYLTLTRPDISYVVQHVCLFMHAPCEPRFHALKRVLQYLKGTLD